MELPPTMTVKVPGATRTVRLPLGPAVTVAKLHTSVKRFGIGLPPALHGAPGCVVSTSAPGEGGAGGEAADQQGQLQGMVVAPLA